MSAHEHGHRRAPIEGRSRFGWWIFGGFALMAAALLALEHRAHLLGWLPWLFLLACPLMHLFMHRGHGHGDPHKRHRDDDGGGGAGTSP